MTVTTLIRDEWRLSYGVISLFPLIHNVTELSPMPVSCLGTDFFLSLVAASSSLSKNTREEGLLSLDDSLVTVEALSDLSLGRLAF